MTDEQLKETQRRLYDAFSRSDYAVVEEIISPNMVEHTPPPPGIPQNRDGDIEWLKQFRLAFPDFRFKAEDISADGNWVWVRGSVTGTHRGNFLGSPATNKSFKIEFFDECRYDRKKMVEHWGAVDVGGIIQQLGITPMMGG